MNNFSFGINIPHNIKRLLMFQRNGIYTLKDENGKAIKVNGNDLKISTNDFYNFSGLSDDDVIQIININLGLDINKSSGLNKLNEIFYQTIDLIKLSRAKIIFDRKKVNIDDINFPFENIDDVIKFIRVPEQNNGWEGKLYCFISKTCNAVNDILNTPGIHDLELQEANFYQKFKQVFSINEVGEVSEGYIGGKHFIFHGRPKSLLSCTLKNLKDVECTSIDKLTDGIQYTFEFDGTIKEKLDLMEKIYLTTLGLGGNFNKSNIKNISKEKLLEEISSRNNKEFKRTVLDKIKESKKKSSSNGYSDIKMIFIINGNVPFEIKIVDKGNKNQDGINFQAVYAYLNKYIEGVFIRAINTGNISGEFIEEFVKDFFQELPFLIKDNLEKRFTTIENYYKELWDDLQKQGYIRGGVKFENQINDKDKILRTYLIPGLVEYFKSKLEVLGNDFYTNERTKLISEWSKNQ